MKPVDFKRWRKSRGFSQKQAAEALGLKRRVVQYYEKGQRDGEPVTIAKSVRLACWAITQGVVDYHGPKDHDKEAAYEKQRSRGRVRQKGKKKDRASLRSLPRAMPGRL